MIDNFVILDISTRDIARSNKRCLGYRVSRLHWVLLLRPIANPKTRVQCTGELSLRRKQMANLNCKVEAAITLTNSSLTPLH